jgi:hypothetical protein
MDVAAADSGAVLVVGSDAPTLRMFDRSGKVLWTSGRDGTGPGEFRLATSAAIGPRGVQVVDMTLFAPDGRYLGEVVVPAIIGTYSIAGRWFVADVESQDGTSRIGLWQLR